MRTRSTLGVARRISTVVAAGALLAAAGLAGAGTAAAAPAEHVPAYLHTTVTQWTHWTPDPYTSTHAGTLYAGLNYFYCWTFGEEYAANGSTSHIWLNTDDDTGDRNVYVSIVNLDADGWNTYYSKLDQCS
ncbi:hypothetical protein [Actinacidiphila guanduensis]|uniref:Uncharacterized protein n=1 Tax=Actinacidiphila guanduensis TaxID=310781 RepID=A0A1G9UXU7_9ACTN|nr:hypothetical protein [Actinacidiphila guanduensis]SDM64728.1 hypothetical protein SAMN05216259_10141 [Actinacidiphila guanduensis]